MGEWGDPFPEEVKQWEGNLIISYLSRWIVPRYLIDREQVTAINFHPGTPDYPGIGCNNFALYDNAKEYGVTCHHMNAEVDTGKIIAVKRFPIAPEDDVRSLLLRSYDFQIALFYEIIEIILRQEALPESKETWARKPYTRKEFNQLMTIDSSMTPIEVKKRVRATSYGAFQPFTEIGGYIFELKKKQVHS